jgi:hypothetical protein
MLHLYPSNPDNIIKIGRTSRDFIDRFNEYKQNTTNPKILFVCSLDNSHQAEKELILIFKNKYTHRKDFGNEYFTGNINDMKQTIYKYFMNLENNEMYKEQQQTQTEEKENYINFLIDLEKQEILSFRKYNNIYSAIKKISFIYKNYIMWCENKRITSYDKNKFIEKLTEAQTGIIKCIYEGIKCFRFNQQEFNEFIKKHSSKN